VWKKFVLMKHKLFSADLKYSSVFVKKFFFADSQMAELFIQMILGTRKIFFLQENK